MPITATRIGTALASALALAIASNSSALAQKKYDPGATDTEIKVGNTGPYSGPASAYSVVGKVQAAYFKKINDEGGINGRKINFISYDDAYSPPKTVEQTRKLVESDEVLVVFNTLGTAPNVAVQKYLNSKQVPHLFASSGASRFNDPKNFPWTIGWQSTYLSEGKIYAKYLMKEKPNAKIAIMYQNDDIGKDYLKGLKEGFGDKISMMVAEESFEMSEPTIDSHIVKLKASGADVFLNIATPKFAAQAIKKAGEIDWKPLQILANISASVGGVIKPAGFENAQGILSASYTKDGSDPQWDNNPEMKRFYTFLEKYFPEGNKADSFVIYGYAVAQTLVKTLEMCGDDLTRANVMKQAASLKDFVPDTVLPGVKINTSATDFAPIEQLQMMRFKGEKWELFGEIMSSDLGH